MVVTAFASCGISASYLVSSNMPAFCHTYGNLAKPFPGGLQTRPNHALQRTPGFGVQLSSAAVVRPTQSRAVRPAMKPSPARAFASRRRAHTRAPGPESLSLGSLGDSSRIL